MTGILAEGAEDFLRRNGPDCQAATSARIPEQRQHHDRGHTVWCECVVMAGEHRRAHGLGGANKEVFESRAVVEQR